MADVIRITPGSPAAVQRGCACPRIDNAHGTGAKGNPSLFWVTSACPIHSLHLPALQKESAHG